MAGFSVATVFALTFVFDAPAVAARVPLVSSLLASPGITQVATGAGSLSCALFGGGTVSCWGTSLNDGLPGSIESGTPVEVAGLSDVTKIALGGDGGCALLNAGTVSCWGANSYGQLGNGSTQNSSTPVSVTGLTGVTQVSAGNDHVCALLNIGTVECWGDNALGQLGNGSTLSSWLPVVVTGLTGVTQISAYDSHTCALLSAGTVECWGDNTYGQLGVSGAVASETPVAVPNLSGVTQLGTGAGANYTCALLSSAKLDCWGDNGSGQLGNGNENNSSIPATVEGLSGVGSLGGVAQVALGSSQSCVLLLTGTADCWGYNFLGALGNGFMSSNVPIPVIGPTGITQITSGGDGQSCVILTGATVDCWGNDYWSEAGNGVSGPGSSSPEPVTFPANEPTNVTAVAQPGGAVISWTPPQNYGSATITSYVASDGSGHSCTYFVASPETDTCTVAFLANGSSYSFSVTAVNAVGPSIASLAAPSVTPATVPDAPSNVTVTNATASTTSGSMAVSWNSPDTDGGSPITSYTATDGNGHSCTYVVASPETDTCTVNNLAVGTSYSFSVTAINSAGTSSSSAISNSVVALPPLPTSVTISFARTGKTLSAASMTSLKALCAKLVAGAQVVVTGYARGNTALARARALAVKNFMVERVAIHVTTKTDTQVTKNWAVVAATKQ